MNSNQTQHTPGPWKTGTNGVSMKGGAIVAGLQVIGEAYGFGYPIRKGWHPESEANARLIAAAPDLLAALEDALQWIEGNHHPVGECDCARCDCLILARAAIARARGEA